MLKENINIIKSLKQSHLGWAVNSLKSAIPAFLSLGYTTDGDICVDNTRKVELILLTDSDGNTIELVAPIADDSPVSGILKANGPAPYHVCFSMNVEKGFDNYKKEFEKNGFIVLHKPSPAPLLQGKDVVFLYSQHIWLIELVLDRKEM